MVRGRQKTFSIYNDFQNTKKQIKILIYIGQSDVEM